MQGVSKTCSENFVDYFPPGKNGMTQSDSTEKLLKMHSKPFIEKNWYFLSGILLLRVAF